MKPVEYWDSQEGLKEIEEFQKLINEVSTIDELFQIEEMIDLSNGDDWENTENRLLEQDHPCCMLYADLTHRKYVLEQEIIRRYHY